MTPNEVILKIMKEKKITQADLARKLGRSKQAVYRDLKERDCPPLWTLDKIADILGTTSGEIIYASEGKPDYLIKIEENPILLEIVQKLSTLDQERLEVYAKILEMEKPAGDYLWPVIFFIFVFLLYQNFFRCKNFTKAGKAARCRP